MQRCQAANRVPLLFSPQGGGGGGGVKKGEEGGGGKADCISDNGFFQHI